MSDFLTTTYLFRACLQITHRINNNNIIIIFHAHFVVDPIGPEPSLRERSMDVVVASMAVNNVFE